MRAVPREPGNVVAAARWLCALALIACAPAFAFPDKPIQYVIPFAAGGESDIAARQQSVILRKLVKQDFIVVNRPGAGGALVWNTLNGQPNDGYLVAGINLPHIVLQPFEGNVQYKTDDLTPVYWFNYTPDAIVVPNSSKYKSLKDLIDDARANPGKVSFAGSGTNSANHAATVRFDKLAGVKTLYVPFKGTGDLSASVLGGHVSAAMSYSSYAITQKGNTRMLAVAMEKRHPQFPDTPTFRELGFDWVDGGYRGVAVPRSTPAAVKKEVSDLFARINNDPEMRKMMADSGLEVVDVPVERMAAFIEDRAKASIESARALGLVK